MEQIQNINTTTLYNSNCLIKVEGLSTHEGIFEEKTKGGIYTGGSVYKYNKGKQALRMGTLIKLPDRLAKDREWETDYFPELGSEVWFDYTEMDNPNKVKCGDDVYVIMRYNNLIMARNDKQGVRMLNGYLLAKKALKPQNKLYIKDEYYDDIYTIEYDGKPNLWYKDERYVDDPSIKTGMTVMTRLDSYPKLENSMYWKFSKEDYYYFQRNQVVSEVEL